MWSKKKEEKEEKTIIKTTERWRSFWKGVKLILYLVVFVFTVYGLYLLFGLYIYGSFFISLIFSSIMFYNFVKVPSERFVESRIEMEKDESGKEKPRNHVFNEYKIPNDLLKSYTLKGSTIVKFKNKTGDTINIVERIDFKNKIIYYPWFSNLSDWDFYIYEETFKICKQKLEEQTRDLRRHEQTRDLYYSMEFIKMLQDVNRKEDYSETEDKIKERIESIFKGES